MAFEDGNPIRTKLKSKEDVMSFLRNSHEAIDLLKVANQSINQPVAINQALKDFKREKIIFNNVAFIPHLSHAYRSELFAKSVFDCCLRFKRLDVTACGPLATIDHSTDFIEIPFRNSDEIHIRNSLNDPKFISNSIIDESNVLSDCKITNCILQLGCRTSAGADCYFLLQDMFEIHDTVLSQRSGSINHTEEPPISINLELMFDEDKILSLVSIIKVWNFFAIYDRDVMDGDGSGRSLCDSEPCPWLEIETIVTDIFNFRTMSHKRSVELFTLSPTKMKQFKSINLSSNDDGNKSIDSYTDKYGACSDSIDNRRHFINSRLSWRDRFRFIWPNVLRRKKLMKKKSMNGNRSMGTSIEVAPAILVSQQLSMLSLSPPREKCDLFNEPITSIGV